MRNPCNDEGWLRQKYINEGLSTVAIAKIAQVSFTTINRWLKSYGIPVRSPKLKGQKLRDPKEVERVRVTCPQSLYHPQSSEANF